MYVVNILMSTYNGEKFISEQINSIMNQVDVNTILTIRDDGSSDKTVSIINEMQKKYKRRIELICGENIGYKKSFLQLLTLAKKADYYGFSDQDDVWMPEKCVRAIEKLEQSENQISLYASGVIVADEELNYIKKTDVSNMILSIPSVFTRHRLAGCTYIFSEELKHMAESFSNMNYIQNEMPSHDFTVFSCALAFGKVEVDDESFIYHRRYDKSLTAGGNGIKKRIAIEFNNVFKKKNEKFHLANEMIARYDKEINAKDYAFLHMVSEYKKNGIIKLKLLFFKGLSCGNLLCDIEARIKILIGNY